MTSKDSLPAESSTYITTDDLQQAVDAALTLERPLLVKGEPGTGKTELAIDIARKLNAKLHTWHVKSTTRAQQGLYEYDAVSRLRDSQLGDERVKNINNYILRGVLWMRSQAKSVALSSSMKLTKPTLSSPMIYCRNSTKCPSKFTKLVK